MEIKGKSTATSTPAVLVQLSASVQTAIQRAAAAAAELARQYGSARKSGH